MEFVGRCEQHAIVTRPRRRRRAHLHRFDLVVTDLNMPGGDGAVLARRIRGRSNVPVLLVTGLDAATPAACGVVGLEGVEVLRKPVVPPQLREAIEKRLESSLSPIVAA
jgi:CheY-like chemotaxis protein